MRNKPLLLGCVYVGLMTTRVVAQMATFDAMSYAVAIENASRLYEQVQVMRENLEYAYSTYQIMEKQIKQFEAGDYWEMMSSLNGIADSYTSLKRQYNNFYVKVGDERLYIKDLATAPEEIHGLYARILSGKYTTAEENAAYRYFGVGGSLREMTSDLGTLANTFSKKLLNSATAEDEDMRDSVKPEKTVQQRLIEASEQSIQEESAQKQGALLSQQVALMGIEIAELRKQLSELSGLYAAQYQQELLDGKSIDVTDTAKSRRQYLFSDAFLSGEDE